MERGSGYCSGWCINQRTVEQAARHQDRASNRSSWARIMYPGVSLTTSSSPARECQLPRKSRFGGLIDHRFLKLFGWTPTSPMFVPSRSVLRFLRQSASQKPSQCHWTDKRRFSASAQESIFVTSHPRIKPSDNLRQTNAVQLRKFTASAHVQSGHSRWYVNLFFALNNR